MARREGGRSGSWAKVVGLMLVALFIGVGVGWAGVTVLRPAQDPREKVDYTYAIATAGQVSSEVGINAVSEWATAPLGTNRSVGIVTSVNLPNGQEVTQGTELYRVNLRPVVIAAGDIPAFRDIARESSGPDVAQVQEMLKSLGMFSGTADGKMGPGTSQAISVWQKSLGIKATGAIELGDIIFVPDLPVKVALDAQEIQRGTELSGGEALVHVLPQSPKFWLPVNESQAMNLSEGLDVEVTGPSGDIWPAQIGTRTTDPQTQIMLISLESNSQGPLCAEQCADISPTGQTILGSKVILSEPARGITVPSAAIVSKPDRSTHVIDPSGVTHPVNIIASANGMTVVEGIAEGLQVQVPARLTTGVSSSGLDSEDSTPKNPEQEGPITQEGSSK